MNIPEFDDELVIHDAIDRRLGSVRRRAPFEAVDPDGVTLGTFSNVADAIAAILAAAAEREGRP